MDCKSIPYLLSFDYEMILVKKSFNKIVLSALPPEWEEGGCGALGNACKFRQHRAVFCMSKSGFRSRYISVNLNLDCIQGRRVKLA